MGVSVADTLPGPGPGAAATTVPRAPCGSSTRPPPALPLDFATPTAVTLRGLPLALEDSLVTVFVGVIFLVGAAELC